MSHRHSCDAVTFYCLSNHLEPPFKPFGASIRREWRLQTMGKQLRTRLTSVYAGRV